MFDYLYLFIFSNQEANYLYRNKPNYNLNVLFYSVIKWMINFWNAISFLYVSTLVLKEHKLDMERFVPLRKLYRHFELITLSCSWNSNAVFIRKKSNLYLQFKFIILAKNNYYLWLRLVNIWAWISNIKQRRVFLCRSIDCP